MHHLNAKTYQHFQKINSEISVVFSQVEKGQKARFQARQSAYLQHNNS